MNKEVENKKNVSQPVGGDVMVNPLRFLGEKEIIELVSLVSPIEIKVKKLDEEAVLPTFAKEGDAGADLTCTNIRIADVQYGKPVYCYHTGIAVEIPYGYVGLLFPRSSIYKTCLEMRNCVGVIDSGYRGEILLHFKGETQDYKIGDRIGQLVIMKLPTTVYVESEELSESERGVGGHGSSGN